MCAEYEIRKTKREIAQALGESVAEEIGGAYWPRVRLFSPAPVAKSVDGRLQIETRSFSLKPRTVPYSTFNARLFDWDERKGGLVRIFDKPTWRKPFAHGRCAVPIDGFVEPIYVGERAGSMVEFRESSGATLFAAGLFESSLDRGTGELYDGFALVMDVASDFVRDVGHHRQPVFLSAAAAREWLETEAPAEELLRWLARSQDRPRLEVRIDRAMARGWEKRASAFEKKAARESEIERLIAASGKK